MTDRQSFKLQSAALSISAEVRARPEKISRGILGSISQGVFEDVSRRSAEILSAAPYIGGQAVIEGVMMRAPDTLTVAVRRPDKSIALQSAPYSSRFSKKLWKWPGFRGVAMLVESLRMGYAALQFSAEQQMSAEEQAQTQSQSDGKIAIVVSVLLALGLFIALPQLLAAWTAPWLGVSEELQSTGFQALIGLFKLLIFTGYVVAIAQLPDVRRVFQYHGAEHKTINAFEKQLSLTVDNVRMQSTLHPRCGTTFLVVVIVVSIILGALLAPALLPNARGFSGQLSLLAMRIALLPVVAAISYELQRLSARFCTTGWRRGLLLPGFAFQKITTREPDDEQIEIAIVSMRAAEHNFHSQEVAVFPSFDQALIAVQAK